MKKGLIVSLALNVVLICALAFGSYWHRTMVDTVISARVGLWANTSAQKESAFAASRLERADIVFLGDSITDAGDWSEYLPDVVVANRGIAGDRTDQMLARIDEVVRLQPDTLFLMAGANDVLQSKPIEEIEANYAGMLDALEDRLPETRIVIQSTLPLRGDYPLPEANARIDGLNVFLQEASQARGHTFLDVRSAVADPEGALDPNMTPDGVHLSGEAYSRWSAIVADHLAAE